MLGGFISLTFLLTVGKVACKDGLEDMVGDVVGSFISLPVTVDESACISLPFISDVELLLVMSLFHCFF
jgi:hypothetical protein